MQVRLSLVGAINPDSYNDAGVHSHIQTKTSDHHTPLYPNHDPKPHTPPPLLPHAPTANSNA